MRRKSGWVLRTGILLMGLFGCRTPPGEDLVALVGEEPITTGELEAFIARIPRDLRGGRTGVQAARSLLETLIDRKLMLLEAQSQGIENDPFLQERTSHYREELLLRLYQDREIAGRVIVADEDVLHHYYDTGRNRALRLAGAVLKSREEALQAIEQLRAGEDPGCLPVGVYLRRDQLNQRIAEAVFGLPVGEASTPFPMPLEDGMVYGVFKVLGEKKVPLKVWREKLVGELSARKKVTLGEALYESLQDKYEVQIHPDVVRFLGQHAEDVGGVEEVELTGAEGQRVLCRYRGGDITLGEFLRHVRESGPGRESLADSAQVMVFLHRTLLRRRLFLAEARARQLHENPAFVGRAADKYEEGALSLLREREIDRQIAVTDEEARVFYDAHPELFSSFQSIEIAEVLVRDRSLARHLRKAVEEGAEVEVLALLFSVRQGAARRRGHLRIAPYTRSFVREIYALARNLEIGEVGGPVAVQGGYSVFQVREKEPRASRYDVGARRRATEYLRREKTQRMLTAYVRGLREKFPVRIVAENLGKLP